jgi:hypothetical protein
VAELYLQAGADAAELRAKVDLLEQVRFSVSGSQQVLSTVVYPQAKVDVLEQVHP